MNESKVRQMILSLRRFQAKADDPEYVATLVAQAKADGYEGAIADDAQWIKRVDFDSPEFIQILCVGVAVADPYLDELTLLGRLLGQTPEQIERLRTDYMVTVRHEIARIIEETK